MVYYDVNNLQNQEFKTIIFLALPFSFFSCLLGVWNYPWIHSILTNPLSIDLDIIIKGQKGFQPSILLSQISKKILDYKAYDQNDIQQLLNLSWFPYVIFWPTFYLFTYNSVLFDFCKGIACTLNEYFRHLNEYQIKIFNFLNFMEKVRWNLSTHDLELSAHERIIKSFQSFQQGP